MKIYPLPEAVCDSHCGDEWALAAIRGERVVALSYLSDIAPPAVIDQLHGTAAEFSVRQWLRKEPMALCELRALGDVSVGIVSSDGFAEALTTPR